MKGSGYAACCHVDAHVYPERIGKCRVPVRRCGRFFLYIVNIDGLNDTICTLPVDAFYAWRAVATPVRYGPLLVPPPSNLPRIADEIEDGFRISEWLC